MITRVLQPALLVVLLLLSSCAPKRSEVLLDTKSVEAPALRKMVEAQQNKLQSMVGKGTVSFESSELGGTAAFEMALKKPDSLLVTFEGPFGIDLGTLFLSRQKYLIYNSVENRAVTGIPSTQAIRSVIPFDLTFEQILNAFSGFFALPTDDAVLENYSIDDDYFLLVFNCGGQRCKYWIDNGSLLVTKYQMSDAESRVTMEATASRITEQDDINAPRHITVTFPESHRQIAIYYTSLTLNAPDPSFAFSIPGTARMTIR